MPTPQLAMLAAALTLLASFARAAEFPLKVDVGDDNGRRDVLTPHWHNWNLKSAPAAERTVDGVKVTLRAAGKAGGITPVFWKPGLDHGGTMVTDGVVVNTNEDAGARLELVIAGLPAGRHGVVTYHNALGDVDAAPLDIAVDGKTVVSGVEPTRRAKGNDAGAATYFQVEAQQGKDLVIAFTRAASAKEGDDREIILNGFELGAADPARRSRVPSPAHGDEHASENPVLAWAPVPTAAAYHVYFGTDRATVTSATRQSPEFKGEIREAKFATKDLNSWTDYFWRVDVVSPRAGEPTSAAETVKGETWTFRVRQLAFPGAEGYGRFARGGRGGRVIEVTNLDDAGPGSLRAAVEADGPRTVVFRVGGTIPLKSKLVIRNPYLTVAGQTAPGDGIAVRGATFGMLGTHDVILRYVRIRMGDELGVTMDGTGFAASDHCIMDHCSISWTIDEGVSSRQAKNITFQRCIVAEALNVAGHAKYRPGTSHGYAGSISGDVGSFHHNLLAHCAGRNWSLAGGLSHGGRLAGRLDVRNNVVYNWVHRTNDGGVKALNLVNNLYIPGPATRVFHLLKPDAGTIEDPQQYFVAGNVMEGRPQYDADNWLNGGVIGVRPDRLDSIKLKEPFCEPHVTTHSAQEAYESVLADVGANFPRHDAVDLRVINDVKARGAAAKGSKTGLPGNIDSQTDVGGWPELKGGEAPPDADHDGMPDAWESKRGLNPNDPADGNAIGDDGYTHLELYLNDLVRPRR